MSDAEAPNNSRNKDDGTERSNLSADDTEEMIEFYDDVEGLQDAAAQREEAAKTRDSLADTNSWSEDRTVSRPMKSLYAHGGTGTHEKKLELAIKGIKGRGQAGVEELYYLDSYMKNQALMDVVNRIGADGIDDLTEEERTKFKKILEQGITKAERGKAKSALEKEYDKFVFGAILAYVILGIWMFSVGYFIYGTLYHDCIDPDRHNNLKENAENIEKLRVCANFYKREISIVQNLTFGLVTAVAISQFDLTANSDDSVQERFKLIRGRKRAAEIKEQYDMRSQRRYFKLCCRALQYPFKRIWTFLIYRSQQLFVLSWILGGMACLVFTVNGNNDNPLFSTGQTWLGVAVTKTYTYFGVKDGDDKNKNANEDGDAHESIVTNNANGNGQNDRREGGSNFQELINQLSLHLGDLEEQDSRTIRWK